MSQGLIFIEIMRALNHIVILATDIYLYTYLDICSLKLHDFNEIIDTLKDLRKFQAQNQRVP